MKIARTINVQNDNFFEFPGTIFVYTKLNISLRKLKFSGIAIDKINDKKLLGYKDSSVELEIMKSLGISMYIASFFSSKLPIKLLKKYLVEYKNSQLIDTSFEDLVYGEVLGYFDFKKYSDEVTFGESCASMVNYLNASNFKKASFEHSMHSFTDKTYALAKYSKIS